MPEAHILYWEYDYGDEGEGRTFIAAYVDDPREVPVILHPWGHHYSRITVAHADALEAALSTTPPEGYSSRGAYEVVSIPVVE